MKISTPFLVFTLVLIGGVHASPEGVSGYAEVHYFDFEIERITGLHEDEIDSSACKYTISKSSFLSLLSSAVPNRRYSPLDVRANVAFAPNQKYFIDRGGMVRVGKQEFSINKQAFAKLLKPRGDGCRPK